MAKDLTADIAQEIESESEHRPIELYIVYLDEYTLYLTDHDAPINFYNPDGNPQEYTPIAMTRGEVRTNVANRIDAVTVKLDNINRDMTDYIADYEFRGRRMIIWRVYEEYLTDPDDYITIFDGLMDFPVIAETSMQVTLKSRLGTLTKKVPRRLYQIYCNWEYGSDECSESRITTGLSGVVAMVPSTTSLIYISGSTYEAYANDYFKYGTIEVTAGNNDKESRLITYSSGVNAEQGWDGMKLAVDYPFSSDPVGDTVTIQQGCDKTPEWCNDQYDNLDNYGGFSNIPKIGWQ